MRLSELYSSQMSSNRGWVRNVVIPHRGELHSLRKNECALEGPVWSNLQDALQSEKSKVKDPPWVEKGLNTYLPGSCSELNYILPKDMSKP